MSLTVPYAIQLAQALGSDFHSTQNDDFCIQNDGLSTLKMMNFVLQMMILMENEQHRTASSGSRSSELQ